MGGLQLVETDSQDAGFGRSGFGARHSRIVKGEVRSGLTKSELTIDDHLANRQWREGWDFDPTCMSPGPSTSNDTSPTSSNARSSSSSRTGKLNYCEGEWSDESHFHDVS